MDSDTLRRVRDLVTAALAVTRDIPRPVPPRPLDGPVAGWDGRLLDTEDLYRAYNRLPASLQEVAAPGFRLCLAVLETQGESAVRAYIARHKLVLDVLLATGLTHDQVLPPDESAHASPALALVPLDAAPDSGLHPALVNDGDEVPLEALKREVDAVASEWLRAYLADDEDGPVPAATATPAPVPEPPPADTAADTVARRPARPAARARVGHGRIGGRGRRGRAGLALDRRFTHAVGAGPRRRLTGRTG